MKKTAITIAVALMISFATVAKAAPKDNTWYAGGKLGWSQFHDTSWYDSELNNDGPTHKNKLGMSAFGGFQINPYVSFEMGYDWLGYILYKGYAVNGAFKTYGVQFTAKIGYPIANSLDVYTRLGSMVWHASSDNNIAGKCHDTGTSPVLASGIEWAITDNIATRMEYQWINNIGDSSTVGVRPDNSVLNVGLSYRFGQQQKVHPIVALNQQEMQTKPFALKADILFDFNKAIIKPESKVVLDQLYSDTIRFNPKETSIMILGFTDRIGPSAYNQFLSDKRTQSVVDYFTSKGISGVRIFTRGMGEYYSVTGNTCDNVKSHSELINCLAPDRRVEIEIKGIQNIIN